MRIPSGVTDQYIYFVAVDATDFTTRETGLSSFTVYRSRNGGVAAAMTTPTINETDTTNMPGVYELLLDEDMSIDSGDDAQEMVFHITATGMAPVTRTIELYRPKITAGNTLGVAADGDISGNVDGSVASVTGSVGSISGVSFPTNFADLSITATTGRVDIASIAGTAQTARDIGASVLLSPGTGTGQISLTSGAVTAGTVSDKTDYRLSATGVDDILDEAIAEPSAVFTWPATLRGIVGWIGAIARNKMTSNSTTQTLRNDADSANIATSTHSDSSGTFTRGEWS